MSSHRPLRPSLVEISAKDLQATHIKTREETIPVAAVTPAKSNGAEPSVEDASTELHTVYARSAKFVWLTLQRLGVRKHDLDDVCHDVFLIAHRRLRDYDGNGKINAWLFGICVRVAANYRRRAHIRLERPSGVFDTDTDASVAAPEWARPDREAVRRESLAKAEAALSRMSPVKRAVLLMFEVEGMSCQAIADELGLRVGTVYSRLHAARKLLARELGEDEGGQHG